jgi:hypothetical protein
MKYWFSMPTSLIPVALTCIFALGPAAAASKYCSKDVKRYDLHVAGFTFENNSQSKLAKKILTDFYNEKLNYGVQLRLFAHRPDGFEIALDECVPGCPEAGFIEKFFSSSCSDQVAKRDKNNFRLKFARAVLGNFEQKKPDYDIFEAIKQIVVSYKGARPDAEILAAISMLPAGVSPTDRKALSGLFMKAHKAGIKDGIKDIANLKLLGAYQGDEVKAFWSDIVGDQNIKLEFVRY